MSLDNLRGASVWLSASDAHSDRHWSKAISAALAAAGATRADSPAAAAYAVVEPDALDAALAALRSRPAESPYQSLVLIADAALVDGESGTLDQAQLHGSVPTLTRHLARRLAPATRVNALLTVSALTGPDHLHRTPMGRLPTPEEIAELVLYLLAGNDFVTGSVLTLDGGWLL